MKTNRDADASGGFTLIELLVVVAIVAILAAIAVPNLLEAQMRAKVSRAANDMRTVAVGLEAYAVDHNGYPRSRTYEIPPFPLRLTVLTTPVAYLESLMDDPFPEEDRKNPLITRRHRFDYFRRDAEIEQGRSPAEWARAFGNSEWKLVSAGPDGSFLPPLGDYGFAALYDPSNGTRSAGDITRDQGGPGRMRRMR